MNGRRHMALAWGLLITIIATAAAIVWLPLMDEAARNRTRILSLEDRITKIQGLASTQIQLKRALDDMRRSIGSENSKQFFVAKSPTLGAADLQRRIQEILTAKNVRQISSQPLNATDVNDFHKLQVTVNFSGSLRAIHDVLYDLEFGQPRIFIEQLLVSEKSATRARRRRQKIQSNVTTAGQELSVRLMAGAYLQIGNESDAPTTLR